MMTTIRRHGVELEGGHVVGAIHEISLGARGGEEEGHNERVREWRIFALHLIRAHVLCGCAVWAVGRGPCRKLSQYLGSEWEGWQMSA